ncbi:hypothetical protein N9600_00075 [Flavobacteriaceae bacterium]|nr:hypothetical protein [Flavobacteriaceae bacterium]
MKKLILIFIPLVFSCSSGSEEVEVREKEIQEIKLTLIQYWNPKKTINRSKLTSYTSNCGFLRNGMGGGTRNTWYSVDTLEIDFRWDSVDNIYNIDLNIQSPSGSEAMTHNRYIGYIKLINHKDGKTVSFNKGYLEHSWGQKMTYFDSNVSEESIKSIFLHASREQGCFGNESNTGLVKSTNALSTVKATSTETIAYNPTNDLIKVGDIYGRYKVTGKEYIWY